MGGLGLICKVFLTKHEEWAKLRTGVPHLDFSPILIPVDVCQSFNRRFGQCVTEVLVGGGLALIQRMQGDNVLMEIVSSYFGSLIGHSPPEVRFCALERGGTKA